MTSVSTRFFGQPSDTMPTDGRDGREDFFIERRTAARARARPALRLRRFYIGLARSASQSPQRSRTRCVISERRRRVLGEPQRVEHLVDERGGAGTPVVARERQGAAWTDPDGRGAHEGERARRGPGDTGSVPAVTEFEAREVVGRREPRLGQPLGERHAGGVSEVAEHELAFRCRELPLGPDEGALEHSAERGTRARARGGRRLGRAGCRETRTAMRTAACLPMFASGARGPRARSAVGDAESRGRAAELAFFSEVLPRERPAPPVKSAPSTTSTTSA